MTARGPLVEVIAHCRHLLFDFDGPICGIFAGLPASTVADHLRATVAVRGVEVPADVQAADDPFDVLRFAADVGPDLAEEVEAELRTMETRATESASATQGVRAVIEAARAAGYGIAVVSDNSRQAVVRYLAASGLAPFFEVVVGRGGADPCVLKPQPHLIEQAVTELGADPHRCVLIGVSVSGIGAAQKAQTLTIGYADRRGMEERLTYAGADAVITGMDDLIPAIAQRRRGHAGEHGTGRDETPRPG